MSMVNQARAVAVDNEQINPPYKSFIKILTAKTFKNGLNGPVGSKDIGLHHVLIKKEEKFKVNTLIYSMGDEAEDILNASDLTEDGKRCKILF